LEADIHSGRQFSDIIDFFQNPSAIGHDDTAFPVDDQGKVIFADFDEPVSGGETVGFGGDGIRHHGVAQFML